MGSLPVKSLTLFGALTEPPEGGKVRIEGPGAGRSEKGMAGLAEAVATNTLSKQTNSPNPSAADFVKASWAGHGSNETLFKTCVSSMIPITGMGTEETPMAEEEVAMAAQEARCRNKVLSAHARSSWSVIQCVRHGIQNIYHASFANEEALDMLEAPKDKHFVALGAAWLINTARHAEAWGIKPGSPIAEEYERELAM